MSAIEQLLDTLERKHPSQLPMRRETTALGTGRVKTDLALMIDDAATELTELRKGLEQRLDYGIALQRAIEHNVKGRKVPDEVAVLCPHHANMLDAARAELAELQKDSGRLELLLDSHVYLSELPVNSFEEGVNSAENECAEFAWFCWYMDDEGRAKWHHGPYDYPRNAIDAAMK